MFTVEGAYDGSFRIVDAPFDPSLADMTSPTAQTLKETLEHKLRELYPGADVDVVGFEAGSIVVKLRYIFEIVLTSFQ